MRFLFTLFLLIPIVVPEVPDINSATVDKNNINTIIECVRDIAKNGDPETHFTGFDPLIIPQLYIRLDAPPIKNMTGYTGYIKLTDIVVQGIPSFEVLDLKITPFTDAHSSPIASNKIALNILWTSGSIKSKYDIDAKASDKEFIGNGSVTENVNTFTIGLEAEVTKKPARFRLTKIEYNLDRSFLKVKDVSFNGKDTGISLSSNEQTTLDKFDEFVNPVLKQILESVTNPNEIHVMEIPTFGKCFSMELS